MLGSPAGQKGIYVALDEEYLPILGKKIKTHYEEKNKKRQQDGSIHIFEITNCLRQSLIFQQYPEEVDKMTIYDCMNFDHGLNSEAVLVNILEEQKEQGLSTEYQKDIDFSGISGHPDYIEGEWVFELKSVNKFKPMILSDSSVNGYVRQVVYYMILLGIEKGRIIVKYNMPFFPEFYGYDKETPEWAPLYKLKFHKETGQFPYFSIKVHIPKDAEIRGKVKMALLNIVKPLYKQGDITKIPRLDGAVDGTNFKCVQYCKARQKCLDIPDEQYDTDIRDILLNKYIDRQMNKERRPRGMKRGDKDIIC